MMNRTDEALCDGWNEEHGIGTPVILTDDFGNEHETSTRSEAWVLPSNHAVVMVEGRSGGYSLRRIKARKATP